MKNELVSLILPIFNIKPSYLKKCFISLKNQSYKNIEIILVDDGSTNNISVVCKKFALSDSRVKFIQQQNKGVSVARNNGLKNASGNYICFIDPDDWVKKDYVLNLLTSLLKSKADFVISDCYVDNNGKKKLNRFLDIKESDLVGNDKNRLLYQLVGKKICFYYPPVIAAGVPWAKMFKKDFIIKNNLSFIPGMKRMQDNIFCLYAIENAKKIHYLPQPLYFYRKDPTSASLKYSPNIIEHFEKYFDETFKFLKIYKKEKLMYQAVYMKELTSFNSFLGRYFFNKQNPKSYKQTSAELNNLLKSKRYEVAIHKIDYSLLTTSEKIFVFCLKNHFYLILRLLISVRNAIIF